MPKIVIYGSEGIGKSTLASQFPDPLFIDTEGSTTYMNVKRTPKPNSLTDAIDIIRAVKNERLCKTLIIDTIDWLERLIINQVCTEKNVQSIEDINYGKGYVFVKDKMTELLDLLTELSDSGIAVILVAHSIIKKFEEPSEAGSYDRYELKLSKQDSPLVKEWCDALLFCNYKVIVVTTKDKKHKGQGGERTIYTTHTPSYDAKNRFGLADVLPMMIESLKPITDLISSSANAAEPVQQTQKQSDAFSKLASLMKNNNVSEQEIEDIVASKGYFPNDMKLNDYPRDFVDQVLVGAWNQVLSSIKDKRAEDDIYKDDIQF